MGGKDERVCAAALSQALGKSAADKHTGRHTQ